MSTFNPVNAYKYNDICGNNVPITNSKFVYGTLTWGNWNVNYTAKSNNYGSLSVGSLYGNTSLVTTIDASSNKNSLNSYNKVINVLTPGIYRLKTTLSFSGSGFGSGNNQDFGFFIDKEIRTDTVMGNTILSINPSTNQYTEHKILSLGYIYSNNGANYSISSNQPYAVLTNKATSSYSLVNNGISVIETILYLHLNTPLYFNISSCTTGNGINATGNFMLELLHANSVLVTGEKYLYNNSNKLNNTFVMILLQNGQNVQNSSNTYYTAYNNVYNALKIGSNVGNSNLIGIPAVTVLTVTKYPIFSVNNTGIYRIRTTLIFSGSGFSNNGNSVNLVWNIQNLQFRLFYSSNTDNTNLANILVDASGNSLSSSKILSVGYLYSNDGPNYEIASGVLTVNLPCRANSSTTLVNDGISVVELIVFLKKENYVSFNIRPGSSNNGNYITAEGNCTLELLAHTDKL